VLEQETGDIRIEGHSDDVPITSRFASNWDLSARATEVICFSSRADRHCATPPPPPATASSARSANDSADSRAKNRRVDIVVYR
jgi:chemotaxis protein MotB